MKRSLALLLAVFAVASVAQAQPGRFATKEELVGFWEMIPLPADSAKKLNKVDPWPMTYQWFAFYEDGSFATMTSTDPMSVTAAELEKSFALPVMKEGRFKYTFDPSGFVVVTAPDDPEYQEAWGVNLITQEFKLGDIQVEPGDILMSLAGGEDMGPVYYRHLRRLK
jgi:hypothetical protein